jgi:hypothetical protein
MERKFGTTRVETKQIGNNKKEDKQLQAIAFFLLALSRK